MLAKEHVLPATQVRRAAAASLVLLLAACGRSGDPSIAFPADEPIAKALQAGFAEDSNGERARDMLKALGGDTGALDYRIRHVVWRNGNFEVHYDIGLRMSRAGADSLQQLYATMIPDAARKQLPEQTLAAYQRWLDEETRRIEKTEPARAQALRATLQRLASCYTNAKVGDRVELMNGLRAALLPERGGWYAEKLEAPELVVRCLPL